MPTEIPIYDTGDDDMFDVFGFADDEPEPEDHAFAFGTPIDRS